MAGITFSLTTLGLEQVVGKFTALARLDRSGLIDEAGAILESSTRERFETKIAPDGTDWVPWSEAYDETRDHGRHSLLVNEGDLVDSIASYSGANEARVGTPLVYAAHHQIGGEEIGSGIPARPYLGVSRQDESDLSDLVLGKLQELLQ